MSRMESPTVVGVRCYALFITASFVSGFARLAHALLVPVNILLVS